MKTGLGIVTYKRPEYFKQCVESLKFVKPDVVIAYNDGSHYDYTPEIEYYEAKDNNGVAVAKNYLLRQLLQRDCDHIFLIEDDITFTGDAISLYINAANRSGYEHLNFWKHGPANERGPIYKDEWISYYPHSIGAFSYYSRHCLETVGLLDERFINAYEHVHHTWKIANAGLTSPFWLFADATGSETVLKEIEGSIEHSSIRHNADWDDNINKAMELWRSESPDCPL